MILPVGSVYAIKAALDFERVLLEVEAVLGEVPEDLITEASRRYLESWDARSTLAEEVRFELRRKILEED